MISQDKEDKAKEDKINKEISAIKNDIDRKIVRAAKSGLDKALRALLKDKAANPAESNNLAFRLAVEGGHASVLKLLLADDRVDPTVDKHFAIRSAAKNGNAEVVKLLLADKRFDSAVDRSLIHMAIIGGHADVVELLLKDDHVGIDNLTLYTAVRSGHTDIVKLLLADKRVNPAARDLIVAANGGYTEIVKLLLKRVDPAADRNAAIITAAKGGHTEVVKLLLADKRVDPAAKDDSAFQYENFPIRIAAENGHTEVVRLLLADKRVNPAAKSNAAIITAAENGHAEVVALLLADPRVNPGAQLNASFRLAAENGHAEVVKLLMKDPRLDPKVDWHHPFYNAAINGHTEVVKLLLADEHVDPAADQNAVIIAAANAGHADVVALLLKDSRVNPAADLNAAIRLAAKSGHIEVVKLLLKDKRVDISAKNFEAIRVAAESGHTDIVKYIFEHVKYHGLPFTEIIDASVHDTDKIVKEIVLFAANPLDYFEQNVKKPNSKISPAQIEALKIILLKEEIDKMEAIEKKRIADDPENAMKDSAVQSANETFEKIVKPKFEEQFMEYAKKDPDAARAKMKAILAIEQEIRGLILKEIEKNSKDLNLKNFIIKNKDELVKGTNEALMAEARNNYFNSPKDPRHAAWRGYDPHADYKGFDNLLTEQKEEKPIFSTRMAAQNVGTGMTNKTASNAVRERVAYYYLLVKDKNESTQEDIANRETNFISELADLRRAHSEDHQGKDAPSCYPGYIGRIANLGYGHTLTQKTVTKKMQIQDAMRPIILDEFKKMLSKEKTKVDCDKLLSALNDLSEKIQTDKEIFTKKNKDKYTDELLEIRHKFTDSFQLGALNKRVNDELVAAGRLPMEVQETKYVLQYVLDPCRGKMMGPIGDAYQQHIEKTYAAELAELKKQEQVALEARQKAMEDLSKIGNPFKARYDQLSAQNRPTLFKIQLSNLENKMKIFDNLADFMRNNLITEKDHKIEGLKAGLQLLLQEMAEIAHSKGLKHDDIQATCEKILLKGDDKYRELLEQQLNDKSKMPGFLATFRILDTIDVHYKQTSDSKLQV